MVTGEAAADAVRRARRLPALGVGLHLVLSDGRAVLPPAELTGLVDCQGRFRRASLAAGLALARPALGRALSAEVRAQFSAFRRTGLALDHANAHHHLHLHPRVAAALVAIGREHGLGAVRVPREPPFRSWRAGGGRLARRLAGALGLAPWVGLLRLRLARAGLAGNDWILGLADTGRLDAARVRRLLARLPAGVTELYCHPSSEGPGAQELAALIAPGLAATLAAAGVERTTFAGLLRG